jgi:hypothetical protein
LEYGKNSILYLRFYGKIHRYMQLRSKILAVASYHDCRTRWVTVIDGYAIVQITASLEHRVHDVTHPLGRLCIVSTLYPKANVMKVKSCSFLIGQEPV